MVDGSLVCSPVGISVGKLDGIPVGILLEATSGRLSDGRRSSAVTMTLVEDNLTWPSLWPSTFCRGYINAIAIAAMQDLTTFMVVDLRRFGFAYDCKHFILYRSTMQH